MSKTTPTPDALGSDALAPASESSVARGGGSGAGRQAVVLSTPSPADPVFDLPWSYDDDRLVLLVRDPHTLFVYWDFHSDTVARAKDALRAEGRLVLRLLLLSGREPDAVRELDLDLGWRGYYFHALEPNRDYRAEVVWVGDDGVESRVGKRSNVACLPPAHPSAWVEDRFVSIPIDVALPGASVFAHGRLVSGGGPGRMHARAWELSGGAAGAASDGSSDSLVRLGSSAGRGAGGPL